MTYLNKSKCFTCHKLEELNRLLAINLEWLEIKVWNNRKRIQSFQVFRASKIYRRASLVQ